MWERLKIFTSALWTFVLPFLRQMMTAAGPILAAAALRAVEAVAANAVGATSDQKRAIAFQSIVGELKQQGIQVGVDVSTSLINAAIEVAVQKLK